MKTGIHPDYKPTTIVCSCGNTIETRSTQDEIHVEICAVCHPFYTGRQKLVDTAGRVERFKRKYGEVGSGKPDEVPDVDPSRAEEEAREALAEEAESEEASDEKPPAVTEETAAEAPPEEAEEEEADAAAEEPEASAEEESVGEEAEESEDEDEEEK